MKNIMVIMVIHIMLMGIRVFVVRPSRVSVAPVSAPRVRFTIWARGSVVRASPCAGFGRVFMGKKVPLRKSIGVMNRNIG